MAEVLVAGAGPTGLLLAGQLAHAGVPVRIVDRQPARCAESRALAVHARTLEMLDRLGLADEFVARGRRVRAFSMWDGRRRLARIDFGRLDSAFPFLLDIPQQETEAILAGYLARAGVGVERSTELVGLVPGADSVTVTLRCPVESSFPVRYVVGCDGAHSTVRRQAGLSFDGHGYPQDWLLADVALDWDRPADEVHIVFNPAGRATVCMPQPGDRWRVILYFAGTRSGPPALEEVADLVAERVPGPVTVSDPTWLAAFRTHRRSASAYRAGRVFLAGDAVHIHSPAGGQGMNTGLLDADNLAWKLAAVVTGRAGARLLDTYQAERAPVAAQVLGLSHRLVRLSSLSAPWQRALRALAVPTVTALPAVRVRAARRISQVYVGYRGSSRLRAGDRAPDADGLTRRGEPVRLHQLLRGGRHTLLLFDGARVACLPDDVRSVLIGDRGGIVDHTGEAHRRYRGHNAYLIRPDGYVAACGVDVIDRYLRDYSGDGSSRSRL
jgi:2-polyprenyl-6-methoxyphenol hydroxylase-like FAD-dependent oxidoreductase